MKVTIKGTHEISVKRFYIPHTIKCKCPKCGSDMEFLGEYDYMSYPTLNKPEMVYSCCDECEAELQMPATLGLTLEYDTSKITEQ